MIDERRYNDRMHLDQTMVILYCHPRQKKKSLIFEGWKIRN